MTLNELMADHYHPNAPEYQSKLALALIILKTKEIERQENPIPLGLGMNCRKDIKIMK